MRRALLRSMIAMLPEPKPTLGDITDEMNLRMVMGKPMTKSEIRERVRKL